MCPIIATEYFEECGHTIKVDTGKASAYCLFGAWCQEVGSATTVFRYIPEKPCPHCAGTSERKKGLLEVPRPEARVPQYRHEKERCISGALAETRRILADAALTDKHCRALLQYILDLPAWMKKGQLVSAFGYGVAGYYGPAWEREMLGLARRRHFDNSLSAGLQKKRAEVEAGKKGSAAVEEKST